MGILKSLGLRRERLDSEETRLRLYPSWSPVSETVEAGRSGNEDEACDQEELEGMVLANEDEFGLEFPVGLRSVDDASVESESDLMLISDMEDFVSPTGLALPDGWTEVDESRWSLEFLQAMDWKLFERLCAETLRTAGYQVEVSDGGINLVANSDGSETEGIAVQCKSYPHPVQLKEVREFYDASVRVGHDRMFFMAARDFNQAAKQGFADDERITLADGGWLLKKIENLGDSTADTLLQLVVGSGAWQTPTCPNCDLKMLQRERKSDGKMFWGCQNFAKVGEEKCWRRL